MDLIKKEGWGGVEPACGGVASKGSARERRSSLLR